VSYSKGTAGTEQRKSTAHELLADWRAAERLGKTARGKQRWTCDVIAGSSAVSVVAMDRMPAWAIILAQRSAGRSKRARSRIGGRASRIAPQALHR